MSGSFRRVYGGWNTIGDLRKVFVRSQVYRWKGRTFVVKKSGAQIWSEVLKADADRLGFINKLLSGKPSFLVIKDEAHDQRA